MTKEVVAIAGATGFVGTAIRNALLESYTVRGLTRSAYKLSHPDPEDPVEWVHCNAYSASSVEQALEGVDYLVYLIHSMVPSSRLTQASFQDLDLLLADNFAQGAKAAGVRQILYIGGLMPEADLQETSDHLSSRFEVEQVLQASGVPVTTLRCGVIVGPGGSSLRILINLVRRLPVMGLPTWNWSMTQPIAIQDVLRAVQICLGQPKDYTGSFDIGGPEVMSYQQMMQVTAEEMQRPRWMFPLPFITLGISKRWVSTISGSSYDLVSPLVDSLRHDLKVRPNPVQDQLLVNAVTFRESVAASMDQLGYPLRNPRQELKREDQQTIREQRRVRSVQRLPLPPGRDARWALEEYVRWLPQFLNPFLACEVEENGRLRFCLRFLAQPLLELQLRQGGDEHRKVLDIVGGLLANVEESQEGRLEFREVFGGKYVIAAIHDFCPSLPWYIYNSTQAVAHLFVMKAFGRHLAKMCLTTSSTVPTQPPLASKL